MTILFRCQHRLWRLIFIFCLFQQVFFYRLVGAQVLNTLVDFTCLQPCFISTCDDLEPQCVCSRLEVRGSVSFVRDEQCAQVRCSASTQSDAFTRLTNECTSLFGLPLDTDAGSSQSGGVQGTITQLAGSSTATTSSTISSIFTSFTTSSTPNLITIFPSGGTIPEPTVPPPNASSSDSTGSSNTVSNGLIAVFVICPISGVCIVAAFVVLWWKAKKSKRATIGSFAGVRGWNNSQLSITAPMGSFGDGEKPLDGDRTYGARGGISNIRPTARNLPINSSNVLPINRFPPATVVRPPGETISASDPYSKKKLPPIPPRNFPPASPPPPLPPPPLIPRRKSMLINSPMKSPGLSIISEVSSVSDVGTVERGLNEAFRDVEMAYSLPEVGVPERLKTEEENRKEGRATPSID